MGGAAGQGQVPMAQLQAGRTDQAEFVICDQTIEPYHKSLKQNAALERSPTRTVRTQTNHLFAALCGYIKLEMLKSNLKLNHFALRTKLHLRALQWAFAALQQLQPVALAA